MGFQLTKINTRYVVLRKNLSDFSFFYPWLYFSSVVAVDMTDVISLQSRKLILLVHCVKLFLLLPVSTCVRKQRRLLAWPLAQLWILWLVSSAEIFTMASGWSGLRVITLWRMSSTGRLAHILNKFLPCSICLNLLQVMLNGIVQRILTGNETILK